MKVKGEGRGRGSERISWVTREMWVTISRAVVEGCTRDVVARMMVSHVIRETGDYGGLEKSAVKTVIRVRSNNLWLQFVALEGFNISPSGDCLPAPEERKKSLMKLNRQRWGNQGPKSDLVGAVGCLSGRSPSKAEDARLSLTEPITC